MNIDVKIDNLETEGYKFTMTMDDTRICYIKQEDFFREIKNKYGDCNTFFSIDGKFNEIVNDEQMQEELLKFLKESLLFICVLFFKFSNLL
jgi:hypothetical protein